MRNKQIQSKSFKLQTKYFNEIPQSLELIKDFSILIDNLTNIEYLHSQWHHCSIMMINANKKPYKRNDNDLNQIEHDPYRFLPFINNNITVLIDKNTGIQYINYISTMSYLIDTNNNPLIWDFSTTKNILAYLSITKINPNLSLLTDARTGIRYLCEPASISILRKDSGLPYIYFTRGIKNNMKRKQEGTPYEKKEQI